jgi:hypothetical protein
MGQKNRFKWHVKLNARPATGPKRPLALRAVNATLAKARASRKILYSTRNQFATPALAMALWSSTLASKHINISLIYF